MAWESVNETAPSSWVAARMVAMPKSSTRTRAPDRLCSKKRLEGFTSRWTIPCS